MATIVSSEFRSAPTGRLVVFDVDDTLLDLHAGQALLRSLVAKRRLGWVTILGLLVLKLRHALGAEEEAVVRRTMRSLLGQRAVDIECWSNELFAEKLHAHIRSEARARVVEHLEAGDLVVLASGSPRQVVELIAASLGVSLFVCTSYRATSGVLSEVLEPVAYGDGKVQLLRSAGLLDARLDHVYTDNLSDLPLIRLAQRATLVNPSEELLRRAQPLLAEIEVVRW